MVGKRETARIQMTAAILAAARGQVAEHGGGGLSMRAVAREVGLVSSAIYRYFPTREALLTTMIVQSYGHLDLELRTAHIAPGDRAEAWRVLAGTVRGWGRASPHEFQLVYGTPIPGYVAPPETVPAAAAVAGHFLDVGARRDVPGFDDLTLSSQLDEVTASQPGLRASGVAAVLAELAALVGFIGLELSGHFVGTADPADGLFAAVVTRQIGTLALAGETRRAHG